MVLNRQYPMVRPLQDVLTDNVQDFGKHSFLYSLDQNLINNLSFFLKVSTVAFSTNGRANSLLSCDLSCFYVVFLGLYFCLVSFIHFPFSSFPFISFWSASTAPAMHLLGAHPSS